MFQICPNCENTTDYVEPVGDFRTHWLLCESCADTFAKRIKQWAIDDLRDMAKQFQVKKSWS